MFGPLFERFTANTPLTVMTRALLENALRPEPLDELFERLAVQQYKRELLFSMGPSVETGPVSSVRTEPVAEQASALDRWHAPSAASARDRFSRGVVGLSGCGVKS